MIAKELVTNLVPPLKTSDTGNKALTWMNEFHVSQLPIVNGKQFLGLITEEDILDMNQPEEALGNHKLSLQKPYVDENDHLYDVLKMASMQKLSLVPVIDKDHNYLGVITLENLMNFFADFSAIKEPGGIIVLEVNIRDYSLSQISRIVESNDANILSMYLSPHPDAGKIEVTIKVNKTDLKHIIATFDRFEYIIKASFEESEYLADLKDNLDSFMQYLNT